MKKTIFVLGMHRSGTSAMAGVLNKLGCYSGKEGDLLNADEGNLLGYFERKNIVDCNENLLSELFLEAHSDAIEFEYFDDISSLDGFGWVFGAWADITSQGVSDATLNNIEECLVELKEGMPSDVNSVVIKDPRISLSFPLWQKYTPSNSPVIIMVRDPKSVAKSLYKRNKILKNISFDLWGKYTRSALKYTKNNPRIIIDYDEFIDNSELTICRVVSFLKNNNVSLNENSINDCVDFVRPTLRHQYIETNESPPNNAYKRIVQKGELNQESVDYSFIRDECGWEDALFLPELLKKDLEINKLENSVLRIIGHPVIKPVISMLRFVKSDMSFGQIKVKPLI